MLDKADLDSIRNRPQSIRNVIDQFRRQHHTDLHDLGLPMQDPLTGDIYNHIRCRVQEVIQDQLGCRKPGKLKSGLRRNFSEMAQLAGLFLTH